MKYEIFTDESSWLAARRNYVTASEAANLCGEGRINEYTYWHEKAGLVESEPPDADTVLWGHRIEGELIQWAVDKLSEQYGADMTAVRCEKTLYTNANYPALAATPDAILMMAGEPIAVIEAKNRAWDSWKEGVPLDIQIQCQVQMAMTELPEAYVVAQLGGRPPQLFKLEFNAKFAEAINKSAQKFLDSIKAETPPAIDGSASARKTLRKLNARIGLDMRPLPADCEDLDCEYTKWLDIARNAQENIDRIKNRIEEAIGDGAAGLLPGAIWTRSVVVKDGYTVKPTTYIQLNRKERK